MYRAYRMSAIQTGNFPLGCSSMAVGGVRLPVLAFLDADRYHTAVRSQALCA